MLTRFIASVVALALVPVTALAMNGSAEFPANFGNGAPFVPGPKALEIVQDAGLSSPLAPEALNQSAELNVQRVYRAEGALQFDLSWGYLPGKHPYNAVVDAAVSTMLQEFSTAQGVGYRPAALGLPDASLIGSGWSRSCGEKLSLSEALQRSSTSDVPLLHLGCEVIMANGSMLGQRLSSTILQAGEVLKQSQQTLYVDTAFDSAAKSAAPELKRLGDSSLFVNISDVEFARALIDLMDRQHWALPDDRPTLELTLAESVHAASFARDGRLLLANRAGLQSFDGRLRLVTDAPGSEQSVNSLALSLDWVKPYLSDWGREVQSSVLNAAPYSGPSNVEAGRDHVNCSLVPCLAVSYDDGPWSSTDQVLAALEKYDQAATFFVLGHLLNRGGQILKNTYDAGHQIGNHSWNHPSLNRMSQADVRWQLQSTNQAIAALIGETPTMFRPPYGAWSPMVLQSSGMIAVMWNVDSNDWRGLSDAAYRALVYRVKPG
ncbi:MAG: polysaccharide deacetylase family protein, partial [Microbacteriaceae bacterium]